MKEMRKSRTKSLGVETQEEQGKWKRVDKGDDGYWSLQAYKKHHDQVLSNVI